MSHGFYFCLERGTTEVRELKGPQMPLGKRKPGGLRKNPSQSPVVRATRVCRGPVELVASWPPLGAAHDFSGVELRVVEDLAHPSATVLNLPHVITCCAA